MVPFKTAGALDGAQVERRVAPLEPRAVAAGLRTRGWRRRRAGTGPTYTISTKGPPRRRAPVRGSARACRHDEDGVPPGRRLRRWRRATAAAASERRLRRVTMADATATPIATATASDRGRARARACRGLGVLRLAQRLAQRYGHGHGHGHGHFPGARPRPRPRPRPLFRLTATWPLPRHTATATASAPAKATASATLRLRLRLGRCLLVEAASERRRRRWATPAAMMVALKTAGAMDGAQVERRVVPLDPRAVPLACARGGWQGRRGVSAGARKQCMHGWCWSTHDAMLARVQAGHKAGWSNVLLQWGGWRVRAGCAAARGGLDRVWGVWATRSCSGAAPIDARQKLLS
jgi:hypothetical protein